MVQKVGTTDLRQRLTDVLRTVREQRETYVVETFGQPQAQQTGDWSTVDEVLESWKATANIEADPALAKAVDEGLIELEEGRGTTWSDLRRELDL